MKSFRLLRNIISPYSALNRIRVDISTSEVQEIFLMHYIEYIFKRDTKLKEYFAGIKNITDIKNTITQVDIYDELVSLGYPIKETLQEYIDSNGEVAYIIIPTEIYNTIEMLYYNKPVADPNDLVAVANFVSQFRGQTWSPLKKS